MKKLLTITIPSYNAQDDLPVVLDNLIKCSCLEKLEVIIVNDGSNDNTAQIAQKYADVYPTSIQIVNKENGGHGSTINTGIRLARGKYFKVVDSDDWLDPIWLDKFVKQLESEKVDVLFNPFWTYDDKTKKIKVFNKFQTNLVVNQEYLFDKFIFKHLPSMHSFTFKTQCLKDAKFKIDEHAYYVDVEYIIFPLIKCNSFKLLNYPLYYYRINQGTQSVSISSMKKNKDRHEFVLTQINKYISDKKAELSLAKKKTMVNRLSQMIAAQFKIISLLPVNNETKHELKRFKKKVDQSLLFDIDVINFPIKLLISSNFSVLLLIHYLAIIKMKTVHV